MFSFDTVGVEEEHIYGTGQNQNGLLNQKGETVNLFKFNTLNPIPVFMSNRGYLFFWNVPSEGRMEFSSNRTRIITHSTTIVDYYVAVAPIGNYDSLLKKYTAVTGRSPMMPDFAMGYIQSKLRYENQSEVIELAQNFVEYDVPVSMIVIDYFNWANQGDFGFQKDLWPEPELMAAAVKNVTGAELMVSLWPTVQDSSVNFEALINQGLLAGTRDGTGFVDEFNGTYVRIIDSTNPTAREFLWYQLYHNYYVHGIHNFWTDQDEGDAIGEGYLNNGLLTSISRQPWARPHTVYYLGTQEAVGMLYPYYHQMGIDEGLRAVSGINTTDPNVQHIGLSRSGWAGSQKFASVLWSGDTRSIWEDYARQIPAGLNMAMSGLGWWTVDIGGFQTTPTVGDYAGNVSSVAYRELFVRWLQWGTFLPVMRVHGDRICLPKDQHAYTCPNEPWSYGLDNFPIINAYIKLRYQLKPYVSQLFRRLSETGRPMLRPLFLDFSLSDPYTLTNSEDVKEQYMFGPKLLVAPVTEPGVTEYDVYLPKLPSGSAMANWTYWWTGETYQGGAWVSVPANVSWIPVFVLGRQEDVLSGDAFAGC
ncbi:hypothetical protein YB2330_006609 [Saitoella coloradoensis]